MKIILTWIIGFVLWTTLSIYGGWKVNTYYTGYQNNLKQEVTRVIEDGMRNIQIDQAKVLTDKLDELKKQDFKILKEKQTIIEKPIYSQKCFDDDGIELLKKNQERLNEIRNKTR